MKMLMCGFAMSLGILTSAVQAEQMLTIDGTEYPLSALMLTCQSMINRPEDQIACFSNLTRLLDQQSGTEQKETASVSQALESLRAVAEYQDNESGLSIAGADCKVQIVYFNNYFHISRRNISTIDLFSAQFDASKLQYDKLTAVQGAQAPLTRGLMDAGAIAAMRGGVALESSQHNFAPISPRMTIDDYANEVVGQLPVREDQAVEFVLIHPQRSQTSADIWGAFEAFVKACKE